MTIQRPVLPIDAVLPELSAALSARPAAVLIAPPGAGKSTTVPLALLEADWRGDGRIVMLEPRRLAARAAARRMASLVGEPVGGLVGYRVRLEAKVSARTRIEVVTEGVFTRMILADPELGGVSAVLFDEFHERSLEGDLGLALAIDAQALRPDLRIVVMSATLDGARVAGLLGDAPVIASEGRAFPVATRHVPRDPALRLEAQVARTVEGVLREERGSLLVFLPGEAEIRRTAALLEGRAPADVDIAPLYGQLPPAEQDKAVSPSPAGRRKVVLATSIAETSLTIEGVRVVIDSGLRRRPAYEPATGLSRLETRPVSRAGAEQRRGRAGRMEPGVCIRLWHEGQALDAFDRPEMLEADLTGLALDLTAWGVADPGQLRFLDPPPGPAWAEATSLLKGLSALDEAGRITAAGKALARLPLHPRLAHMVQEAASDGAAGTAALLAVLLGERGLGGEDVDLAARLDRFRREGGRRAEDARRLAEGWARLAGGAAGAQDGAIGIHLARAYPDRVAQAVDGRGRFRLANGRQASLDESEGLARAGFLVVSELSGAAGNARIRGAVAIAREEVEALFADRIAQEVVLGFDRAARAVRARRVRRLGALKLSDQPAAVDDAEAAARLLAEGIAETGIAALPWSREQAGLLKRARYLFATLGAPWPDLSEAALARDKAGWLAPHIMGRTALAEITPEDLSGALEALLPWERRGEIEALLPSHFTVPTGSRIAIDYEAENGPVLAVRVQELFGLDTHPSVAGGRVALLLHLLSPAQRPIQTTRDLPGFWRGSWKDVAKDLRGRYPRHPWPDDPLAAAPTSRAKPRGS